MFLFYASREVYTKFGMAFTEALPLAMQKHPFISCHCANLLHHYLVCYFDLNSCKRYLDETCGFSLRILSSGVRFLLPMICMRLL